MQEPEHKGKKGDSRTKVGILREGELNLLGEGQGGKENRFGTKIKTPG
jgi:hypothetical protein